MRVMQSFSILPDPRTGPAAQRLLGSCNMCYFIPTSQTVLRGCDSAWSAKDGAGRSGNCIGCFAKPLARRRCAIAWAR